MGWEDEGFSGEDAGADFEVAVASEAAEFELAAFGVGAVRGDGPGDGCGMKGQGDQCALPLPRLYKTPGVNCGCPTMCYTV